MLVSTPAGELVVTSFHLGLDPDERRVQARALLDLAMREPRALVVCGDLNEERGDAVDALGRHYELHPRPGSEPTCCYGEEPKTIDYVGVLRGSGLRVVDVVVAWLDYSDHAAVVALLERGD